MRANGWGWQRHHQCRGKFKMVGVIAPLPPPPWTSMVLLLIWTFIARDLKNFVVHPRAMINLPE